ncbi:hypothetical protein AA313_de0201275 [Arthrobotrys entomopaga]|nr:hypothetical protein AA313_de0201275 [Arthrobotrys entomopaga]
MPTAQLQFAQLRSKHHPRSASQHTISAGGGGGKHETRRDARKGGQISPFASQSTWLVRRKQKNWINPACMLSSSIASASFRSLVCGRRNLRTNKVSRGWEQTSNTATHPRPHAMIGLGGDNKSEGCRRNETRMRKC